MYRKPQEIDPIERMLYGNKGKLPNACPPFDINEILYNFKITEIEWNGIKIKIDKNNTKSLDEIEKYYGNNDIKYETILQKFKGKLSSMEIDSLVDRKNYIELVMDSIELCREFIALNEDNEDIIEKLEDTHRK